MGGVICLANATIQLQTGFATTYMVINICYWIGVAPLPADHWNLTRLTVSEIRAEDERTATGKRKVDPYTLRSRYCASMPSCCCRASCGRDVQADPKNIS
jgi:hypothetical protein